ncbi:Matrix metalloproteinase-17 [Nymphon striatum]|nr:Matrix metalloproteinase-17 [Nymphon striatum]
MHNIYLALSRNKMGVLLLCAEEYLIPFHTIKFMMKYGYLADFGPNTQALYSKEGIREAIKRMQSYGGLVPTGTVDDATLALFTKPRCGVKDVEPDNNLGKNRQKRYAIASDGWKKNAITYRVGSFPRDLSRHTVMRQFNQAFKVWSDISPLTFHQTNAHSVDMDIMFRSNQHEDNHPFDGQGNVLAHAFFPNLGSEIRGDVHFDMDEKWQDLSNDDGSHIDGKFVHNILHEDVAKYNNVYLSVVLRLCLTNLLV